MRINYNVSALVANNALNNNDNKLSGVSEKLSTGFKINHAKDNPSGLAIAKRMNLQLRGLSDASRNASDGISVVQTAEGAIQEIQEMVQRMNELAVQAANGTNTDEQRGLIQNEIKELKNEISRITEDTEFNGKKLLNGDLDHKGYSDNTGIKVEYYSKEVNGAHYAISAINPVFDAYGELQDGSITLLQDGTENAFPADARVSYNGKLATINAENGFEMIIRVSPDATGAADIETIQAGALRMQIGANEGEVLEIRIASLSLETMGLDRFDVSTEEMAKRSIDMAAKANEYISKVRSRLGAYQNRLEHTTASLDATNENLTGAYSRIMDTDMAEAMTEYSNQQVLTQAGTTILAQANERPQQVLQLLQ